MDKLNISVAGIRGIWGQTLFLDSVIKYTAAFGKYLNSGKVVVGRDTRTTGRMLNNAVVAALISAGCEIMDIGVCPTPTCQLMVKEYGADGGIVITASHNQENWNGLKFLIRDGDLLDEAGFKKVLTNYNSNKDIYSGLFKEQAIREGEQLNNDAISIHKKRILNYIDADLIRGKGFKVAVDACNGAGSKLLIPLLEDLGCRIFKLHCLENGHFPRGPEPMPENLGELCALVRKEKLDIGFAVDPDADRLSIVSEQGKALGEEMSLPLAAQHVLKKKGGVVVTNVSTSMAVDFVAQQYGAEVFRTKIGEAHVVEGIRNHRCYVGGEGNGGIIIPEIHCSRDSGVGAGIILDYMAGSNDTISALAGTIPVYFMVKRKVDFSQDKIGSVITCFKNEFAKERIDTTDGIKIIWDNSWLHIRRSGTENIIRVFSESTEPDKARELAEMAINRIMKI